MYLVNNQIIDEFAVYDATNHRITNLTFAISAFANGMTSNQSVSILESPASSGFYSLTFTPGLTGNWFFELSASNSAMLNARYFVNSGVSALNLGQVWTDSGTGMLHNIQPTGVTASTNYQSVAQAVWGFPTSGNSVSSGSMGQALSASYQIQTGKWQMLNNQLKLFDADGVTILKTFNLFDENLQPSLTGVTVRVPI